MRCFLALELPSEVSARLRELAERLRPVARGVRWVGADQLHLTLHFFGELPEERLAHVGAVAAPLCGQTAPLHLAVKGAGCFGPRGAVRVLWAGLDDGAGTLRLFQEKLEKELNAKGFSSEERPFSPHLTLGRAREPRRDPTLLEALAREAEFEGGSFTASHLTLFSSTLTPQGSVYRAIETWPLGG